MSIDLKTERLYSLRHACRHFVPISARSGNSLHVGTMHRWIATGIVGRANVRIRLEAVKVGGAGLCTSREAVHRFFEALSRDADIAEGESRAAAHRQRPGPQESSRAVSDELDAAGF